MNGVKRGRWLAAAGAAALVCGGSAFAQSTGQGDPADAVYLQHWVFGLPSRVEFQRIRHTHAFYLPLSLPRQARVEYKLEVVRDGKSHWMRDPRNPHLAFDPFGSNSVCRADSYSDPEWTQEDPTSRRDEVTVK